MPGTSFTFDDDLKSRIDAVKSPKETISQFAYDATVEKVSRLETRDERSRRNLIMRDEEALLNAMGERFIETIKRVVREETKK